MLALHRVQLFGLESYLVPINQSCVVGTEPNCVFDARPFLWCHRGNVASASKPRCCPANVCGYADNGYGVRGFFARTDCKLRASAKGAMPTGARRDGLFCSLRKFVAVAHKPSYPKKAAPIAGDAGRLCPSSDAKPI